MPGDLYTVLSPIPHLLTNERLYSHGKQEKERGNTTEKGFTNKVILINVVLHENESFQTNE